MKPLRQTLALTSSVLLLVPGVFGRPLAAQFDATDKYSAVLDLVFPDHWDQCRGAEYLSFGTPQITIRILPGLSQESQIFICRVEHGGFFVVSSTLDQKEGSVWGHTQVLRPIDDRSSVQEENPESAEKIAASIHPIHKSCSIDSRVVEGWFRKLARVRMSLPVLGGGTDGVFYEVTLEHGMDVMRARIWVDKQQKPLTTLVEDIQREIEKSHCTEIQRGPKQA
jgi:hypothetical protein